MKSTYVLDNPADPSPLAKDPPSSDNQNEPEKVMFVLNLLKSLVPLGPILCKNEPKVL